MKRLLAMVLSVLLLLSAGVVMTSAGDFVEPVGNVEIQWLDEYEADWIEFDGDPGEWDELGLEYTLITRENMVAFHKDNVPVFNPDEAISEDFFINMCLAADPDYLYVMCYVQDDAFAYGDSVAAYNGDALQFGIDWNMHIAEALEEGVDYSNNKNIFYSFSCMEDGAPLEIVVQEGFKDRVLSEYTSADWRRPDIKGSASSYYGGWCAEFCLSWELLYGDFEYKTWESYEDLFGPESPLTLGMTLRYIDRSETAGPVEWAAGTVRDDRTFYDGLPTGNGMFAVLDWQPGREVYCKGIYNYEGPYITETETELVTVVETGSCVEIETEVDTEFGTEIEDVTGEEETTRKKPSKKPAVDDDEDEDDNPIVERVTEPVSETEKETESNKGGGGVLGVGCGSVITSTALVFGAVLAAGAVLCKKKKNDD